MKPSKIMIHCSATKDSGTVSWGAIRDWHVNHNGWSAIGYHFGIELVGDEYEILLGRIPDKKGAHCPVVNDIAIGICCVGDYDNEPPPAAMMAKCLKLVRYLMRTYGIDKKNVEGHREKDPRKTCPGARFDMDKFRSLI